MMPTNQMRPNELHRAGLPGSFVPHSAQADTLCSLDTCGQAVLAALHHQPAIKLHWEELLNTAVL